MESQFLEPFLAFKTLCDPTLSLPQLTLPVSEPKPACHHPSFCPNFLSNAVSALRIPYPLLPY